MLEDLFKGFVVLDAETTSLKGEEAEICEISAGSFKDEEWKIVSELRGTKEPLPAKISAVTHISKRMLSGKPLFGSDIEHEFNLLGIPWGQYFIAHNGQFDRFIIQQELHKSNINDGSTAYLARKGYITDFAEPSNWICSLELSKRLLSDETDKFSLNYLRYYLDLDVPDDVIAHRAGNDVLITAKLLEYCVILMIEQGLLDITKPIGFQLVEYCNLFIPYTRFPFGKHKGLKFEDIPKGYYEWAIANMDALNDQSDKYDERLVKSLEPHLSEIFK